jgi:hypothetical protein
MPFYTEADLPLATETVIVEVTLDAGREVAAGHEPRPTIVERKIVEGTRVPADLVDAWREQTGGDPSEGEIKGQETEEARVEALAKVQKAVEAAKPGETPESEQGDPAPARQVPTRPPGDTIDGLRGAEYAQKSSKRSK